MEILFFQCQQRIKEVLDWLFEVECFFDFMDIPEDKKVKLVAIGLKVGVVV